jgi:hypothetical protein
MQTYKCQKTQSLDQANIQHTPSWQNLAKHRLKICKNKDANLTASQTPLLEEDRGTTAL